MVSDGQFNCKGCKYFRASNGEKSNSFKYCQYAADTKRCRIIDGKIIPASVCFNEKVFFEPSKNKKQKSGKAITVKRSRRRKRNEKEK